MGEQYGCFSLHEQYRQFFSPVWPSSAMYLDTQHAALVAVNSLTPFSILDLPILISGSYTFYMLYRSRDGVNTASVQFYINGVPYDVAGSTTGVGLIGYTKVISVTAGDLVSYKGWVSNVATYCDINRKDFWQEFTRPVTIPWLYHYLLR